MKKFKSFDPPLYTKSKKVVDSALLGVNCREYCAICGHVFGAHFGDLCPINPCKAKFHEPTKFPKPLKIK